MRSLVKPGLCFVLAVLLPIDPNLVQCWVASAQAQEAAKAKKELSAEDLKKMADEMERAFKALEAAEKEIPRDTFDPKAIVDKVGRDPVKLFEWVRDNTYWVPYQGCLRGHIGVLMDRLGSSLDRALLLAELLRTAGHKVRLAHANLPEAQAKELLPKLRPVPKDPLPPTPPASKKDLDQLIEKYAKEYNLDAAEMRKNMDKASLQAAKLAEDVVQRVADQVPRIVKAVGKPAEKDVQAMRAREVAAELAALRDYWWVQRQDNDAWLDLDPLLPDAELGKALAKAKETIAPNKDGRLILPSKYCHEVNIRVVIEQWKNERVTEKTVLNHTLRPSELFGQRIALNHYPMKWPKDLDLFKEKKPLEKLKATVVAQDEWLPILTVGSEQFIESSFTDSGDTIDKPLAPVLGGGAQKLGGNIGGILGSGRIGQAPGRGAKRDAQLTAEWIDYEIRSPGHPAQKIRRKIFELLGPAARAQDRKILQPALSEPGRLDHGLALLQATEILPLVCQLPADFVGHLMVEKMLANRKVFAELLRQVDSGKQKQILGLFAKVTPLPGQLYDLALARGAWARFRGDVYLDRPNVLNYYTSIRTEGEGKLLLCRGFDIVANNVAVRPGSAASPFLVRLEQGVLDTNAEALLLTSCAKVENTAEIFSASAAQGVEWLTIRSNHDPAWQTAQLPSNVRARIEQDLASGNVAMVPTKAITRDGRLVIGWWRVNPTTGQSLGIGENGNGQATTEHFVIAGVVTTGVVFAACAIIAWYDQDGLTVKDGLVCAGTAVAGGIGVAGAAAGTVGWGVVVAVAILTGLTTGIWLNKDIPDR